MADQSRIEMLEKLYEAQLCMIDQRWSLKHYIDGLHWSYRWIVRRAIRPWNRKRQADIGLPPELYATRNWKVHI